RQRDQPPPERRVVDPPADPQLTGEQPGAVARIDERHPEQVAVAAYLPDHRHALERRLELIAEPCTAFADVVDPTLLPEGLQDCQADRARERRTVPGEAAEAYRAGERRAALGLPEGDPARAASDRVEDAISAEHRPDRRIAGAESL